MSQYGSTGENQPDPNQPDPYQPDPYQGQQPPQPPPSGAPQDPYGAPPPAANPYQSAQQDPYGAAPAANPYSQPYGQPYPGAPANPYGNQPAYAQQAAPPANGYAPWIKRVGATLIDLICQLIAGLPLWIGYGIMLSHLHTTTNADGTTTTTMSGGGVSVVFILLGLVTYLGFAIWNTFIRQGRTGYSIGKGVMGIRLVSESDGQPIGALMSFVRQVVHIVDSLVCYIGYLWPLWDRKCQTFADKIMHTVVVNQPQG